MTRSIASLFGKLRISSSKQAEEDVKEEDSDLNDYHVSRFRKKRPKSERIKSNKSFSNVEVPNLKNQDHEQRSPQLLPAPIIVTAPFSSSLSDLPDSNRQRAVISTTPSDNTALPGNFQNASSSSTDITRLHNSQTQIQSQESITHQIQSPSTQPKNNGTRRVPYRLESKTVAGLPVIPNLNNDPVTSVSQAAQAAQAALFPSTSPRTAYQIRGQSNSDEWAERGAAVHVQKEADANGNVQIKTIKKGVRDFTFGRVLGEGSFSTVVAATDRQTLREYAIKILDKRHIIKEKKVKYVNIEKNTLNRLGDHPGIVRLYYTFQDERSLYFVLDLAPNGELFSVLKRLGNLNIECSQYYSAQLLDAIEFMHSRGVIHRDLKPENILLDKNFRIKVTDFGTAKLLDIKKNNSNNTPTTTTTTTTNNNNNNINNNHNHNDENVEIGDLELSDAVEEEKANSFVGTAEYVSPELLTEKSTGKSSDIWAFGCILFQLISGKPPFKASNEYQTFQKIIKLDYQFPPTFAPVAKDLVSKLIVTEPSKRLTIEQIKAHPFFSNVEFGSELWQRKPPRLLSSGVTKP
ncbi:kinase-like domain-containing protein [Lipomyces japonicus]|uniref:kinase-like domain-containing protein n=1 Tax=Lipomyces japonicus TaxID=56871 RepID=UPI0034CF2857